MSLILQIHSVSGGMKEEKEPLVNRCFVRCLPLRPTSPPNFSPQSSLKHQWESPFAVDTMGGSGTVGAFFLEALGMNSFPPIWVVVSHLVSTPSCRTACLTGHETAQAAAVDKDELLVVCGKKFTGVV